MVKKSYNVIVPSDSKIKPFEFEAALILADYFKADVRFLSPSKRYKTNTADFVIDNIEYELKSPITKSPRSIENLIHDATKQSFNIVVDIRKSKIKEKRMMKLCEDSLRYYKKIKKIVLIVNKNKVLEFIK